MASYSGPADFGGSTRTAYADGTNSLADIAGNFFGGMFSYAEGPKQADANIGTAFAAVNAMGTQSPALADWVQSMDADARTIDLTLGTFSNQDNAIALTEQFAILGSVAEEPVTVGGRDATRLRMTYLKPGVSRIDVLDLARELGLNDIKLN